MEWPRARLASARREYRMNRRQAHPLPTLSSRHTPRRFPPQGPLNKGRRQNGVYSTRNASSYHHHHHWPPILMPPPPLRINNNNVCAGRSGKNPSATTAIVRLLIIADAVAIYTLLYGLKKKFFSFYVHNAFVCLYISVSLCPPLALVTHISHSFSTLYYYLDARACASTYVYWCAVYIVYRGGTERKRTLYPLSLCVYIVP